MRDLSIVVRQGGVQSKGRLIRGLVAARAVRSIQSVEFRGLIPLGYVKWHQEQACGKSHPLPHEPCPYLMRVGVQERQ